jgi:predicted nuclease of predicted toxin-antitoxin system
MKFIVDAHLPRRVAAWFISAGHDALHTFDLPAGNRSTDQEILGVADRDARILVTKDSDFVDSHLLTNRPAKLLLVSTGNISNRDLERLLVPEIPAIVSEFLSHNFLELDRSGLIVRG